MTRVYGKYLFFKIKSHWSEVSVFCISEELRSCPNPNPEYSGWLSPANSGEFKKSKLYYSLILSWKIKPPESARAALSSIWEGDYWMFSSEPLLRARMIWMCRYSSRSATSTFTVPNTLPIISSNLNRNHAPKRNTKNPTRCQDNTFFLSGIFSMISSQGIDDEI